MISAWWILLALAVGAMFGVLIIALMSAGGGGKDDPGDGSGQ